MKKLSRDEMKKVNGGGNACTNACRAAFGVCNGSCAPGDQACRAVCQQGLFDCIDGCTE